MPTVYLQVWPHGQRRILGKSTLWKMGFYCACNIMMITRISTLQSILRSEHRTQFLYSMISNPPSLWEDPQNLFIPSYHCYTPGHWSEGPMEPPRWAIPSPPSHISYDALYYINFQGHNYYKGQWRWFRNGWRWWTLWRTLWPRFWGSSQWATDLTPCPTCFCCTFCRCTACHSPMLSHTPLAVAACTPSPNAMHFHSICLLLCTPGLLSCARHLPACYLLVGHNLSWSIGDDQDDVPLGTASTYSMVLYCSTPSICFNEI